MKLLKNKYVIFSICMILSGIIAFVIVPINNEKSKEAIEIVRVTHEVEKNSIITEDMLTYETVIPSSLPSNIIKDKKDIIGKISSVTLLPEDNLTMRKFIDDFSITNKELYNMNDKLAVSISIKSLAASLSGKLMTGDIVSVYGFKTDTKQLVIYDDLNYIEVLAVTNNKAEDLDTRKPNSESDTSDSITPATITFSVNKNQAKELIELENTGSIHIVFVGRGEETKKLIQ